MQEQWYSLEGYEENSRFLENFQKRMKARLEKHPSRLATPLELHEKDLQEIQLSSPKENQQVKEILKFFQEKYKKNFVN